MKKLCIFLIILCSLGALIYYSPRLLNFRPVNAQVAARISTAIGWQVDASHLHWHWFPVPHFSLSDITMTRGGISIAIPETKIFPRWLSLLQHRFDPGELKLVHPKITVTSWPKDNKENSESPLSLPRLDLTIVSGTAEITAPPFAKGSGQAPLLLTGINSHLRLAPDRADLKGSCVSPRFTKLKVQGSYQTSDGSYQGDYEVTGLELGDLIPDLLGGRLHPKISGLAIQGNFSGQGPDQFRVEVAGDFPCFLLPRSPDKSLLDCGEFACTIDKNPGGLDVTIAKLALKNPAVILSGRIGVSQNPPPAPAPEGPTPPTQTWLIDLKGRNLDVSAIRRRVLDLFGDNQVAQLVCEIVRGGAANSASYYFKGGLTDFNHLEKMRIKVDVDRAEIHPPGTKLDLQDAGGPIEIRNGYLSGRGLRARLGNSTGSNCELYLDLLGRHNDFKLDLDIQADLAALPQVLLDEVKHPRFQEEVRRFHHCRGQAHGHLHIGDTLHAPAVTVLVDRMEGQGEYDRVSWPFSVTRGTLAVYPERVSWREVKGEWGGQEIHDTAGEVSWNGPIHLTLGNLSASLDLAPLFRELNRTPAISARLRQALTGTAGDLELKNAEFSGELAKPESWLYHCSATSTGSRWTSPLLPQPFAAEDIRATISQDKVELGESRLRFLGQPLTIQGSFRHNRLEEWQGQVAFSGTIQKNLADWIRLKGWIPAEYFPRIPCTLDRLSLSWDPQTIAVRGTVKAGTGTPGAPEVRLDISDTAERFTIRELVITARSDHGRLSLQYPKNAPSHLSLDWQGFVEADSIATLLSADLIHAKRLEGDFSLQLPLRPGEKNLRGWLKALGMEWPLGDPHNPTLLRDLNLRGQPDGTLNIEMARLDSGESKGIEISGTVNPAVKQLEFKLNLNAEKLTRDTVTTLVEGLGKLSEPGPGEPPGKIAPASPPQEWPKRGSVQFRIDRFESAPLPGQVTAANPPTIGSSYTLAPARGFVTLPPSGGYSLDLRSSKVCGLDISGTIYSTPTGGETALNFFTDSDVPPLLQKVIPCFGFQNTLIEGPLHLDGTIQGTSQKWRAGKITLYSENGFIRRLGFLAKVFSVVNLTDLFTNQKLPQLGGDGFAYSSLEIESHIENNQLVIEKAVVKGKGLNLFGSGKIDLQNGQADLIIMVAPLKSIDAIITNLPLIGQVAGGRDKALISIPVGLKGDLRDPSVTLLPAEAIGEGIVNLIVNTFKMPLAIFSPLTNLGK